MRWPQWIAHALRLGPQEVSRVRPGLPEDERRLLRDASAQPDEAVQLLVRRLRRGSVPARNRSVWKVAALGVAVIAMAFIALRSAPQPEYGAIALAPGETTQLLQAELTQLGPSIAMRGLATVQVLQADEQGTVVRIERGSAHFEVDPNGPFRALTVLADDTRVRVTGTEFVVHRLWDSVHVDVLRGSVLIDRGGALATVLAGESWSHDGQITRDVPSGTTIAAAAPPSQEAVVPPPDVVPTRVPPTRDEPVAEPTPLPTPQSAEAAYADVLDAVDANASPASVARALDAFLRRWPESTLVPEATALRLELAADLEPPEVVFDDVSTWLDDWPAHPRRVAMMELAATIARDRLRDCGRALPLYRSLATDVAPTRRPSMLALQGLCALEMGDRDEAREALLRAQDGALPESMQADVADALSLLGAAPR